MAKRKAKMGRPTKYKPEYNALAYRYCLLGATDDDLAQFFGVTEKTVIGWRKDYPAFSQSVLDGKVVADAKVAESFYKRAIGYEHQEDKIFCTQGEVTTVSTTKRYPPDEKACLNWLKNRQPDKWRDKRETELSGSLSFTEALSGATDGSDD